MAKALAPGLSTVTWTSLKAPALLASAQAALDHANELVKRMQAIIAIRIQPTLTEVGGLSLVTKVSPSC